MPPATDTARTLKLARRSHGTTACELAAAAICANFARVPTEGAWMVTREVKHDNRLDDGR